MLASHRGKYTKIASEKNSVIRIVFNIVVPLPTKVEKNAHRTS